MIYKLIIYYFNKSKVEFQKNMMKDIDIDQLDDLRDEMEEMKEESDYVTIYKFIYLL